MSGSVKIFVKGKHVLHNPIRAVKIHPNAEIPFKENETDAGWDITVVSRCDSRAEDVHQDVNTFSTGMVIRPPPHYHFEVFPHPALYKAGYMLAGSPLIINPEDDEELILPLYKYRESEDLELPFRAAILVLRLTEYAVVATETAKSRAAMTRVSHLSEEEIEFVAPAPKKTVGSRGKQTKANHMF